MTEPPDALRITLSCMTPRRREVMLLVAEGLTNKAIGERLHISDQTVKNHVTIATQTLTARGLMNGGHSPRARIAYLLGYANGIIGAQEHAGMVYKVVLPKRAKH